MAKRIRAHRHTVTTYYDDAGAEARVEHEVSYLKEDVDDATLSRWVDVETPDISDGRTVSAQRAKIEAGARTAEGIASR